MSTFKFAASIFFLTASLSAELPREDFVTYKFSGGRFGDNLLAYLHAKWISYRYEIPLLYKPFDYSSELVLDDEEMRFNHKECKNLEKNYIEKNFDPKLSKRSLKKPFCLYICRYFPECRWERANLKPEEGEWVCFDVDWKDPGFRAIVRKLIAPKTPCSLTLPPPGCVSIAIHYREGGGYDTGKFAVGFPTKFPSLDFYVEGLLKVIDRLQGKPLYCYLFTDAANPLEIIEKFKRIVPQGTEITFDCRQKDNVHNQNVLEDFFSLSHFDVLIHSQSNFSLIPSLIHDFAITYSPLSAKKEKSTVSITQVNFEINDELYRKIIQ